MKVPPEWLSVQLGSYPDRRRGRPSGWSSGDKSTTFRLAANRQAVTRVNLKQASKVKLWTPTRPIFGEGRSRQGRNRWVHLTWSTGVMRMACRESILCNVGDPFRMWGSGPQQHFGYWSGRESERGIVPEKTRKRERGKAPYLWHASEGNEERWLAMSLKTPDKIRNFQRKLYLKAKEITQVYTLAQSKWLPPCAIRWSQSESRMR